jgi:hypothetical protein
MELGTYLRSLRAETKHEAVAAVTGNGDRETDKQTE